MNGFFGCLLYLALVGIVFFFMGRLFPLMRFSYYRFPFKPFRFEKNGEIYLKIGIRKWQSKLPDMSRVFSQLMTPKKLPKAMTVENIEYMVRETCIAELTHNLLCIMGLGCVLIWKGVGGWVLFVLYMLGNIPFSLVQRYNRPKLVRLLKRVKARENDRRKNEQEKTHEESIDIKLQHWARA